MLNESARRLLFIELRSLNGLCARDLCKSAACFREAISEAVTASEIDFRLL